MDLVYDVNQVDGITRYIYRYKLIHITLEKSIKIVIIVWGKNDGTQLSFLYL